MWERSVRMASAALIFAAWMFACCQNAEAAPVTSSALKAAAAAASVVEQAQYAYRRTKHGFEKCYHRNRFGSRRQRLFSSVPHC